MLVTVVNTILKFEFTAINELMIQRLLFWRLSFIVIEFIAEAYSPGGFDTELFVWRATEVTKFFAFVFYPKVVASFVEANFTRVNLLCAIIVSLSNVSKEL